MDRLFFVGMVNATKNGDPVVCPPPATGSHEKYWSQTVSLSACESLLRKYRALLELTKMVDGPERKATIRTIASSWPGALREAELAGPQVCARRHDVLAAVVVGRGDWRALGGASKSQWKDRGEAGIVLWNDLHAMLICMSEWRGAGNSGGALGAARIFLACPHQHAIDVWNCLAKDERLEPSGVAGQFDAVLEQCSTVRPRLLYVALAHVSGLSSDTLSMALFERVLPRRLR